MPDALRPEDFKKLDQGDVFQLDEIEQDAES